MHRYEHITADVHLPPEKSGLQSEVPNALVIGGGTGQVAALNDFLPRLADMVLEHWGPELKFREKLDGSKFKVDRDEPLVLRIGHEEVSVGLTPGFKLWREVNDGKVLLTRCDDIGTGALLTHVGVIRTILLGRPMHAFFTLDQLSPDQGTRCVVQF